MKTLTHIALILLSCLGLIALLIILGWAISFKTCGSFTHQWQAQWFYQRNPVKYAHLDNDQDQIACESLVP